MSKRFYHTAFLIFVSYNLFAQVKIITRADSLFFIGIDNEITIQSSKIPVDQLTVNVSGGTVSVKNGKYFIHCSSLHKDGSIKIFHKKRLVAEKKIQVVRISDPVLYVAGDTLVTGGIISKKQLLAFNSVIVKTNIPYLAMTVIRFDFKKISDNQVTDSLKNTSHIFSSELKKILKKTEKNDIIIFENAVSLGPDNGGNIHSSVRLIVKD